MISLKRSVLKRKPCVGFLHIYQFDINASPFEQIWITIEYDTNEDMMTT